MTMPGLLRGAARTAVIAGTATAVSNRVSRRQANRWVRQEEQDYQQGDLPAAACGYAGQGHRHPAEGTRRAEIPGHPDRRRVPGAEGEDPGHVRPLPAVFITPGTWSLDGTGSPSAADGVRAYPAEREQRRSTHVGWTARGRFAGE